MKRMNLKKRLQVSWKLLFSDKPIQDIVDKEVTPILNDYKTIKEKFSPIIENLVNEAWRENKGITTCTEVQELTRLRLTQVPVAYGIGFDTDDTVPLGHAPYEKIRFEVRQLSLPMQLKADAKFVQALESLIKRVAAKEFVRVLEEGDYIKYQIIPSCKPDAVNLVCWINTIQR